MKNHNKDTASGSEYETTPADLDNLRFRVVCRSLVPAMFECCGCYVPVTRLGLICFDDELSPAASDAVIEIELINGQLRHVSQLRHNVCRSSTSLFQQASSAPSDRQIRNANWCTRRRQHASTPEPKAERDWAALVRPARNRSEQNVELILDDHATSSNPIFGRTKDIDDLGVSAVDFRCPVRLRTIKEIRPGDELAIWYGDHLGRLIGVPTLSSLNIRGAQCYTCVACSMSFHHPNPLKSHMMYNCPASTVNQSASQQSCVLSLSTYPSRNQLLPPLECGRNEVASLINHTGDNLTLETENRDYLLPETLMRQADGIARHVDWRRTPEVGPMDPTQSSPTSGVDECRLRWTGRSFDDRATCTIGEADQQKLQPPQLYFWRNFDENVTPMWFNSPRNLSEHSASSTRDSGKMSPHDGFTIPRQREMGAFPMNGINLSHVNQSIRHNSEAELIRRNEQSRGPMDSTWTRSVQSQISFFQPQNGYQPRDESPSEILDKQPQQLKRFLESLYPNSSQKSDNVTGTLRRSSTSSFSSSSTCSPSPTTPVDSTSSADRRSGTHRQQQQMPLQQQSTQQGTMSHKCVHCGKVYSRRYGLTIHLRTHSGDKPLECPVCRRPFGDPSNLNKHVRLHAAAVASTASSSSVAFNDGSGNYQAVAALQALRDSPYRCHHCGKVLVRRRDLERHIRSRHPGLVAIGECRTAIVA